MITQKQLVKRINKIVTCRSLSDLDFARKDVLKEISRASTVDRVTKSSLKSSLRSKVSKVEMGLIRNQKAKVNSFVSKVEGDLRYITTGDWIRLRGIESEVKGPGSKLSWVEKALFGVSFPSAKQLLNEIHSQRTRLISLIEDKKREFEEADRREEKRRRAIALLEKKRREKRRRKKKEQERRRREAERKRREMLKRMGKLKGN